MVGCKVNNRIVPIDHVVATGEIIEVILGPADKGPSRDWLKIVRTSEAKSKIRNWFKKMRREENIQQGRDALAKELRREMIFIPDDQLDEFVGSCSRRLRQNNAEEIYAAIGYGGMTIANCLPKLKEEWQKLKAAEAAENKSVEDLPKVDLSRVHATDGVVVEGFDNTPIKFAKCCSPLPGDPIVGFITRGFGVSIHKQSCANAVSSMKDPSNAPRWVKAYWADSVKDSYKAGLEIIALNRNELLSDVLAALADIRVPIYAMNARQVENNCAVISLTIGINNTEHLNRVVARLSKVKDQGANMRAVIQAVSSASVRVNGGEPRPIGPGLVILLGVKDTDTLDIVPKLAEKCACLRIFKDENDKLNLSAKNLGYSALVVSQFTLYGDTKKGFRPSFIN